MNDKVIAWINLREMLQYCNSLIDELNNNSIAAFLRKQNKNFDQALNTVEKVLFVAEIVMDQDADGVGVRAATMFLLALWSRLKQGESAGDLTQEDWNEILRMVYDKAVTIDPIDYTLLVFDTYRRSIAFAIMQMRSNASPDVLSGLEEIVSLMDAYAEDLRTEEMSEAAFIEENLWLSLEAIFLVMTDRMNLMLPEDRRELAEAIGALAFQKFRYSHYEKELAAIDACLGYQDELDKRLTEEVNEYIAALKNELDEFDSLVEQAFNTSDFRLAFKGSVDLAESLGAEGILKTQQEIDDYFML